MGVRSNRKPLTATRRRRIPLPSHAPPAHKRRHPPPLRPTRPPAPPPGVGGAGIFAVGFHNPTTLVPWARQQLSKSKPDWMVSLIGINDLLREGRPADDVVRGLQQIWGPALARGVNVMAIAPLPAPGFVSRCAPRLQPGGGL